jgi:hypothetical protein
MAQTGPETWGAEVQGRPVSQSALEEFATKARMVAGRICSIDPFNPGRHPSGSNFTISQSMPFVDYGAVNSQRGRPNRGRSKNPGERREQAAAHARNLSLR